MSEPASPPPAEFRRSFWQRLADAFFGYDFFISYAHADGRTYAAALARSLRQRGFDCFLDTEDYAKGDNWKTVGAWALRRTSRLVLVGTPRALESGPVLRELEIFTQAGKRVIPIDFEGSLAPAAEPGHPVARLLDTSVLRLGELRRCLTAGPSSDVLGELTATFRQTRQRDKRQRWLQGFSLVLVVLLALAVWQALEARAGRRQANRQLAEASWAAGQAALGTGSGDANASVIKATHNYFRAALAADAAGDRELARDAALAADIAGFPVVWSIVQPGKIHGVIADPQLTRFITWGASGTVQLWDVATRRLTAETENMGGPVLGGVVSPDKQWLLTWAEGGTARLWQTSDGKAVGLPMSHGSFISQAIFSPDQKQILTWDSDGARLWDAQTCRPIGNLMPPEPPEARAADFNEGKPDSRFERAEFSPDGGRILAWTSRSAAATGREGRFARGNSRDRFFRLWDSSRALPVGEAHQTASAIREQFSADSSCLLAIAPASPSGPSQQVHDLIQLWKTADGTAGPTIDPGDDLAEVFFNPGDNTSLISRSLGRLQIWKISDGSPIGERIAHSGLEPMFTADGARFVTWSETDACLRNARDGTVIGEPFTAEKNLTAAILTSDGNTIATLSAEDSASRTTITIWRQEGGNWESRDYHADFAVEHFVLVEPDGKKPGLLLSDDTGKHQWWNLSPTERNRNRPGKLMTLHGNLNWCGDARHVWIQTSSGATLWDALTGDPAGPAMTHDLPLEGAQFSSDGSAALTWGEDQVIRFWQTNEPNLEAAGVAEKDTRMVLSPDGSHLLTWTRLAAKLWNPEKLGEPVASLADFGGSIEAIQFTPDGSRLIVQGKSFLRIFRSTDGAAIGTKIIPTGAIKKVQLRPDGRQILVESGNGIASLWDLASCRQVGKDIALSTSVAFAQGPTYSPDSRHVLALVGGGVRLWGSDDALPGAEIRGESEFGSQEGMFTGANFSHDGRRILVSGIGLRGADGSREFGTFAQWRSRDTLQAEGPRLPLGNQDSAVVASPDSRRILTAPSSFQSSDTSIRNYFGSPEIILRDAATGSVVGSTPFRQKGSALRAVFSNDGKLVLTWGARTARLWRADDGSPVGRPMEHNADIVGASFTHDSRHLLIWASDFGDNKGGVWLWNASNTQGVSVIAAQHPVEEAFFTPDENHIITRDWQGAIQRWNVGLGETTPVLQRYLEFQVRTGTALGPDGEVRALTAAEWNEHKAALPKSHTSP